MLSRLAKFFYLKYYHPGFDEFRKLEKYQFDDRSEIKKRKLQNLNSILNYAYLNVPYYSEVIGKSGLLINDRVQIKSFKELDNLPVLSKDIIREQKERMYSKSFRNEKYNYNTSGGSTGEPVRFLQDPIFESNRTGNFHLVCTWRKKNLFKKDVYLWGAQRDLYGGKNSFKGKLIDFVLNRKTFNTAKLSEIDMIEILEYLNKTKPELIVSYVNSIYELSIFIEKNGIKVHKMKAIHTGAGKLHDFMRVKIESIFDCKVYDHYGSREVGSIASECRAHNGLHILEDFNYVELIDDDSKIIDKPDIPGDILITQFTNHIMPLIRYKIEDVGVHSNSKECDCGVNYSKLKTIEGRTSSNFKTINNEVVSGEFLTLTFNHIKGVKNFQIVQNSLLDIKIYLVTEIGYTKSSENIILNKFQKLFTDNVEVEFRYIKRIKPTPTGKHLYTVSNL